MNLSPATAQVLAALRANAEGCTENGWRNVYLDNALPAGMSDKSFRSHLAALSKVGLYRPIDGYAFGDVKVEA